MHVLSVGFSDILTSRESHHHTNHQLLFVTEGKIDVCVSGRDYRAKEGDLLILSRLEPHSIRVQSKVYKRFAMEIAADGMEAGGKYGLLYSVLVNRIHGFRHVVETGNRKEAFSGIFSEMTKEFSEKAPFYTEKLDALFLQLLVQLYRTAPELFCTDTGQGMALASAVRRKLETEMDFPHTLESLAAEYHVSPSHLSHTFKAITGYAPIAYLMACRLSAAKQYLSTTEKAVSEIVFRCGYSDSSNFCRMFKEKTGQSPTEFRRMHKDRNKI